jgi:hypothetical protein
MRLAGFITAAAGVLVAGAAFGAAHGFVATAARPAIVPLERVADALASAEGPQYVQIAVRGYRPASDGPVEVVVEALAGAKSVEIGRFGVFPNVAFTADDPAKVQRFRLTVPTGVRLDPTTRLRVRLVPELGAGKGASIELDSAGLS